MKFSQKIGKSPVRSTVQIDDIDNPLKIRIWNIINEYFLNVLPVYVNNEGSREPYLVNFFRLYWIDFRNELINDLPKLHPDDIVTNIRNWFFEAKWYELYDFIEFIIEQREHIDGINTKFNNALKIELSGYRIINKQIVQLTSDEEIKEIEDAINGTSIWTSVNTHLKTSLKFLTDRKEPDYRNSIKESISAVEALCRIITNKQDATLGEALNEIEKKHSLHKALKKSFSSLYGYSSDESGIRHSLNENGTVIDFEEAKFMLVSCSAFINYLKAKFTP